MNGGTSIDGIFSRTYASALCVRWNIRRIKRKSDGGWSAAVKGGKSVASERGGRALDDIKWAWRGW